MLTKEDAKMAQGLAILSMIMLHLFCRRDTDMYNTYIIINETPMIYYLGLFGDICVPIYCFSSGYAQSVLWENEGKHYRKNRYKRIWKLINHFWLVVILFSVLGVVVGSSDIPGNMSIFLGNILLYRITYNGAWWFVLTYVVLIVVSPIFIKLVQDKPGLIIIGCSGIIYLFSYVLRMIYQLEINDFFLNWVWTQILLIGTSQFSFVVGMVFFKYQLIEIVRKLLNSKKVKYAVVIGIPGMMFVFHCMSQSMIVAPITGISTLVCFHLWEKPKWIQKIFKFLGKHSTNIWLTHMFFYLVMFENLVFCVKEPILIVVFMVMICVTVSYTIEFIQRFMLDKVFIQWDLLSNENK